MPTRPASAKRHATDLEPRPAYRLSFPASCCPDGGAKGQQARYRAVLHGEVSEWLKEHAWKVCMRLNPVSRVRIPPSPPSIERIAADPRPAPVARTSIYGGPVGASATIGRKLRQVRKEATVSTDSGAGITLAGLPPLTLCRPSRPGPRRGACRASAVEAKIRLCQDRFSTVRRPMAALWAKNRRKYGPHRRICSPASRSPAGSQRHATPSRRFGLRAERPAD